MKPPPRLNLNFPKRRSWQLTLGPCQSADGVIEFNAEFLPWSAAGPQPLYVEKLYVFPAGFAPLGFLLDGASISVDSCGNKAPDEEWFRRWAAPALINPDAETVDLYYLKRNAVYLVVKPGQAVTLRTRWAGGSAMPADAAAVLIGWREETDALRKTAGGKQR